MVVLITCVIFYAAYQGRIAWLLLATVLLLPGLSLILSLVPIFLLRSRADFPKTVTVGDETVLNITVRSPLPLPPCHCPFTVTHAFTGERLHLNAGATLPTEHCGMITCTNRGFYAYDFLNLFRFRLKKLPPIVVLVRPAPISMEPPKDLDRYLAQSWKPKYGGGFAENHELRLYRPGDTLHQVHWKLSAKTGKLMIREPMVPRMGRVLLTIDLTGHSVQLDRKLGRLLWMGTHLISLGMHYDILAMTGNGPLTLHIFHENDLTVAIDTLLRTPPATTGTILSHTVPASWQMHIGGDRV